jgi:hypothetical protein
MKPKISLITFGTRDLERMIAGVSLPIFLPAVESDGRTWTDAVWIKDANLLEAVRRGCTELWLVWCIGNTPLWGNGPLEQYVHMIELSANGQRLLLTRDVGGITMVTGALFAGLIAVEALVPYALEKWLGISGNWALLFAGLALIVTLIQNPDGVAGAMWRKRHAKRKAPAPREAAPEPVA